MKALNVRLCASWFPFVVAKLCRANLIKTLKNLMKTKKILKPAKTEEVYLCLNLRLEPQGFFLPALVSMCITSVH